MDYDFKELKRQISDNGYLEPLDIRSQLNREKRIAIRMMIFRRARREGATWKQARAIARRAWDWVDDGGNLLPLSDAPACRTGVHPFWVE